MLRRHSVVHAQSKSSVLGVTATVDPDLQHRRLGHRYLPGLHHADCLSCSVGKYTRRAGAHEFSAHTQAPPGIRWHGDFKALVSSSKYPYVFRLIDPSSGYIHDTFLVTKKHDSERVSRMEMMDSCFLVARKVS